MKPAEYARLDATDLASLVARGHVTPSEVLEAARDAIEAVEPNLNALAFPLLEHPRPATGRGPLDGVPFLVKDVAAVAEGVPWTAGSRLFQGSVAPRDRHTIRRVRDAGSPILGATATPEFSLAYTTESYRHGITRNPWNPELGVGGSSGGAAAIVAAGGVPASHATDGAGSIRVPASSCGVVGLKPTRGRTPIGPYVSEGMYGLSHDFVVTRTVRDTALLLGIMAGSAAGEKYLAPPRERPFVDAVGGQLAPNLRVAVQTTGPSGIPVNKHCADAAMKAARVLHEAGSDVMPEAELPIDVDQLLDVYVTLAVLSVGGMLAASGRPLTGETLEPLALRIHQEFAALSGADVALAFSTFNSIQRSLGDFFSDVDVLITPTLAQLPAPHGRFPIHADDWTVRGWLADSFTHTPFTAPFNVGGQPAMNVPIGEAEGVPVGVQLVAAAGREDVLLTVAAFLEETLPWRERTPKIYVA